MGHVYVLADHMREGDPCARAGADAQGGGGGDLSSVHAAHGAGEGGKGSCQMTAQSSLIVGAGAPEHTGQMSQ